MTDLKQSTSRDLTERLARWLQHYYEKHLNAGGAADPHVQNALDAAKEALK